MPRDKLLRAIAALRKAAAAQLTLQEVRSLCGLLEHVRGVLFGGRHWMFGVWSLVDDRTHPGSIPQPSAFSLRQIDRWVQRLLTQGCASALSAFARLAYIQARRQQLTASACQTDGSKGLASLERESLQLSSPFVGALLRPQQEVRARKAALRDQQQQHEVPTLSQALTEAGAEARLAGAVPLFLHVWPDAARRQAVIDRRGVGGFSHGRCWQINTS